jgi:hypothetical protein
MADSVFLGESLDVLKRMSYEPETAEAYLLSKLHFNYLIQCNLIIENVEGGQEYIGRHFRFSGKPRHFDPRHLRPIRGPTLTSTFTSTTYEKKPLIL